MSLVLSVMLAALTLSGGKGESIEIASRRCDFDREGGVALFEGDVRVDYNPGYVLTADRLYAFFQGTNKLDRIVALGRVSVTNETRYGGCDRAVFRRGSGELEMFASENGELARLVDPGASELKGRRIKFWVDAEQVEVTGSEITVEKKGGEKGMFL